jgi:hypothetical protein
MALPILGIAAGIAARAVAKKAASRAVGGIVGAGAKSVNPVYRNIGPSVKVVPGKTPLAPKPKPSTGLENRGVKPTRAEQGDRARTLQWDKAEKNYDSDTKVAGYRGGPNVKPQGPKGKNLRKQQIIAKEAKKKAPVKINSNPMRGK